VRVVEMHTIKPLDSQKILESAEETGAIVTAEEANIIGGLGGAVAEVVAEASPVPVVRVGIADRFTETGPYMDLLNRYGLAVNDVVQAAHKAMVLKEKRRVLPQIHTDKH
jgi:transketolase